MVRKQLADSDAPRRFTLPERRPPPPVDELAWVHITERNLHAQTACRVGVGVVVVDAAFFALARSSLAVNSAMSCSS